MAKLKGTSSLPRKEKRKAHKLAAKEKKQQRHASRAAAALQASTAVSLSSMSVVLTSFQTGCDPELSHALHSTAVAAWWHCLHVCRYLCHPAFISTIAVHVH